MNSATLVQKRTKTTYDCNHGRPSRRAENRCSRPRNPRSLPQQSGVAKGLFARRVRRRLGLSVSALSRREQARRGSTPSPSVTRFCDEHLDPARIDREADIPREVIDGLARLGVLGMTAPRELGGRGFSQLGYGRILEVLGGRCSSTSIFVNAHHSIGMRALLLFGTEEQTAALAAGPGQRPQARRVRADRTGSRVGCGQRADDGDAVGRRQRTTSSTARSGTSPTAAIADVLTVMARTPVPGSTDRRSRRFSSRPTCRAFESSKPRMEKLGIRGTATAQAGVREHGRAEGKHPRPARQGAEGRADGARLRPHDVRRLLHRRGEDLPAAGRRTRAHAQAVRPHAGRVRAGAEEARPAWPRGRTRWKR